MCVDSNTASLFLDLDVLVDNTRIEVCSREDLTIVLNEIDKVINTIALSIRNCAATDCKVKHELTCKIITIREIAADRRISYLQTKYGELKEFFNQLTILHSVALNKEDEVVLELDTGKFFLKEKELENDPEKLRSND